MSVKPSCKACARLASPRARRASDFPDTSVLSEGTVFGVNYKIRRQI